jgi:PAS domain S-box-containing protein
METSAFRNLLRRTLLLPLVLLVLLAATLVIEVLSLTSSLRWIDHSDRVMDTSRQAMRTMVEMESSLRGYELSRDPRFVDSFQQSKAQLPDKMNQLIELTADNQLQQRRLKEISQLDNGWIHWAEQEIAEHASKPPIANELLSGVQLMDEIRSRQREVIGEEERLLHERSHTATVLGRVVLISAIGLSFVVAVVLLTVTRRELRSLNRTYEDHLKAEAERTRELQENREFFRITLNSLAEGVIATDAQELVTFINPAAQELTKWESASDVIGHRLHDVLHIIDEASRSPLGNPVEELVRQDGPTAVLDRFAMVDRSGNEFPVEVSAAPILNDVGKLAGVVIVFRDIAQRRQTEETLRASERLNQAGRLSATIAHEIRNPLDTVTNLVYLLQHDSNSGTMTRQYLQMASEELARITQITGQLLTFHREARHPVEVSIVEVLDSVLTLYGPQLRKAHIHVDKRIQTHATIRGFPGELRQVFSNLVGNSIDAMPHGGRLLLSVREGRRAVDLGRKGVRTTIVDSGSGIPLGVRRNLFAPFYTTKGEKGTGLGLWVSRGIVEKHEGTIHVVSSVRAGRTGTAFSVFLPFEQVLGKLDVVRHAPAMHA